MPETAAPAPTTSQPAAPKGPGRFAPVPAIGAGGDLLAEIDGWLSSEPLRELVRAFGGGPDILAVGAPAAEGFATDGLAADDPGRINHPNHLDRLDTLHRIERLFAFTDRWDIRKGRERNLVGDLDLTDEQRALATAAGEALGLRGPETLRFDHYDHVLILGGLIRACLARAATAAQLLRPGAAAGRTITAGAVTALSGHRPFAGDEFEQAAALGLPELADEFQALDAGTRRAFGLGEPTAVEHHDAALANSAWDVHTYEWQPEHGGPAVPVRVVAAPSSEPHLRRANTSDTYAFFLERFGAPAAGSRLLVLSTTIHVLPQHLAALRLLALPHGAQIDTVSARAGSVPGMPLANFTPTKYLLEIRTTIMMLRQLVEQL